jgi:RNA polymerase sigma-70 factor, ECF subfamily
MSPVKDGAADANVTARRRRDRVTFGGPAPSSRQGRIGGRQQGPHRRPTAGQVTEKFIAACTRGDLDGLLEVLAPDAWGDFDAGPDGRRAIGVVRGAVRVARHLLYFWGPPATLVTHPVAGQPALLGFTGRELSGVLVFTMRDGLIQAVHVIGDPRKLGFLSSQLA